jgi:hypothetical protein
MKWLLIIALVLLIFGRRACLSWGAVWGKRGAPCARR